LLNRQDALDEKKDLMMDVEKKMDQLSNILEITEKRISHVHEGEEKVKLVQQALGGLESVIRRTNIEKARLDKERGNLDNMTLNIEKLTNITEDAESKIDQLNSKIKVLGEVEKRLSSLNLLAEDVSVKIQNLKKDEALFSKAGNQITELKFLLGEVERKKEDSV
jgi:DNA repair ATPase RecN